MTSRYPYDILLAGIGIGGELSTTSATIDLLRRSRIAYCFSCHDKFVKRLCPNVTLLDDLYYGGKEDVATYRTISAVILDEAVRGPGVAVVVDGHPRVFDDVSDKLLRGGPRRGIKRVTVKPAVSCLDAILCDARVRFSSYGVQIVEASTLVACEQMLNTEFDTFILQVGWFNMRTIDEEVPEFTPESLRPLQQHLLRFYPRSHRVRMLLAPYEANGHVDASSCRLDRLAHQCRKIDFDTTLYLQRLPD